jgi:hypothetical protein
VSHFTSKYGWQYHVNVSIPLSNFQTSDKFS